jgi:predicted transcriptional regulator
MSGIFDRLQKRLEIESQEDGISPLDLAALPPLLRKIMRYMLREYELLYSEILEWVEGLPEAERPSIVDLDAALQILTKQFWLIRRGEGQRVRYQANLRRKAGSKLAQGVWNVLDAKIASRAAKKDEPAQE